MGVIQSCLHCLREKERIHNADNYFYRVHRVCVRVCVHVCVCTRSIRLVQSIA